MYIQFLLFLFFWLCTPVAAASGLGPVIAACSYIIIVFFWIRVCSNHTTFFISC